MEHRPIDDKLLQGMKLTREKRGEIFKEPPPPKDWKEAIGKAAVLADVRPDMLNQHISVFAPQFWFDSAEEQMLHEKLQKSPMDAREVFSHILARQVSTCFFLSEVNKLKLFNKESNKIESSSVDAMVKLDRHMLALMEANLKLQMPANLNINNNTGTVNVGQMQQINHKETDLTKPVVSPQGEQVETEASSDVSG